MTSAEGFWVASVAALSGEFDTLMDLGTHWADMACYLMGNFKPEISLWRSYVNAAAPHRDTHVHLRMAFGDVPAMASVSKTHHGFGNHFEIHVIGERQAVSWEFGNPDGVWRGRQGKREWVPRAEKSPVTEMAPNHGLGWTEGYAMIVDGMLKKMQGETHWSFPSLDENLSVVSGLIRAASNASLI